MFIEDILIVGAGGHAKVVLDAIDSVGGDAGRVVVTDADPTKVGVSIAGRTVVAWPDQATLVEKAVHVAIGSVEARGRTQQMLTIAGSRAVSLMHPRSVIAPTAVIGDGSFIAALAVIGPDVKVEEGVLVNHGAVVDHDCVVGAFSHIAPNATLGGGVAIGDFVLVGAGATILPGVKIGDGAIIAAGATIVRDVARNEKVIFEQLRKKGADAE